MTVVTVVERPAFRGWLAAQDPGRRFVPAHDPVTGGPSWACGCPLATYCREALGLADMRWGWFSKGWDSRTRTAATAGPWAGDFTLAVDGISAGVVGSTGITAGRALSLLDDRTLVGE